MSRIPIASLVYAACILAATVSNAMIPFTPEDQPVVLGEWHNSYSKTREIAFGQDIPIVAIWGSTTCGYCDALDAAMSTSTFITWRQNRKLVLLYAKNTATQNNKDVKAWVKNSSLLWPYCLVYWKGQTWKFTGRYSGTTSSAKAQQFINQIESYVGAYTGVPQVPPETDAFDPADNSEATATRLAMTKAAQSSKPHYLNKNDTTDWYRFTNLVASTEYRVWLSDFTQAGATGLTATFYRVSSATPLTNMPLASLTNPLAFTATNADDLLLKINRKADTNATVTYTLNYREWVPCTVSFDTNAVAVGEAASQLLVIVRRTGDKAATTATLTFSNGTATAGADYVSTPVNVAWTAGGADVQTARVSLVTDTVWEGNETFSITLTPDPATAHGGLYMAQTVTIIERTAPTPGQLGYTYYGPVGNKKALTSYTRIPVREGEDLALWVARTGGTSLPAAANFTWSDGSAAPAPLNWASLEGGEKGMLVTIPDQTGYQPVRTLYLDLAATGATAASGKTRAAMTVTDSSYISSLAAYVALNPAIPFKTSYEAWFRTHDSALRCVPPTATGASLMNAALTGPGVLFFTGAKSDSGVFTLKVGSRAAQAIATDGSQTAVVIPAGAQSVVWSFSRDAGSDAQSFASITAPGYVKLPAATPVAPVTGSVVREGPLMLRWSDALAGVRDIDGVTHEYRVYAGTSSTALTLVGGPFAAGPAPVAPVEPVTSALVNAAVGTLYWRVDMAVGDGVNQAEVKGTVFSTAVVSSAAPAFAVAEEALQGQSWFDGLVDGGTLKAKMQAGVRVAVGPLPANAGAGVLSVKVKSGVLPTGLSLVVEGGAIWLKGIPAAAGSGTVVLQVSSKVGLVTTAGTTLAFAYTTAPLPAGAYGLFNGGAEYEDATTAKDINTTAKRGLASMTVASTGKTSGKFVFAGRTYTFSALGYDFVQTDGDVATYWITNSLSAVYGTNRVAFVLAVNPAWPGLAWALPAGVDQLPQIAADLSRNGWTDRPVDAARQAVMADCAGYYTAVLPDNDKDDGDAFGSSYLALTVSASGTVTATGKLADNTSVSMSGTLLLDNDGNPYVALFTAPSAYLGGFFFARIGFDVPEGDGPVALSGYAIWRSDNLQATGTYGAGFDRVIEVTGGFYNKTQTLIDLYTGIDAFDASAVTWTTPVPLGLNVYGSNFTVPVGGPTTGNPNYLRLTASRTTGLFSGSFRSGAVGYTTLYCYGALTPTLAGEENPLPLAGRGFFLERATTAAAPIYSFNLSRDFAITPDCGECGE